MQSGKMDRRVLLRKPVAGVPDGYGHAVVVWQDMGTVWAAKSHSRDAERFNNAEVQSEVELRFQLRWSSLSSQIDATWRVVFEGREYEIIGAPKEMGRRSGIEISCKARAEK